MTRGVFQATITDAEGNVLPSASVEVRDELSGDLVQLYEGATGSDTLGNPATADANGFIRFYADQGTYRIDATLADVTQTWRHVPLISSVEYGTVEGELSGFASNIAVTFDYRKVGTFVTILLEFEASGTSTSTALSFGTLPTHLRPSMPQVVPCLVRDGGSISAGYAQVVPSGTVLFFVARTDTITNKIDTVADFTASNTKGLPENFHLSYSL